jgi:hypothetical protein
MRWIILAATHGVMLAAGFALGIYLLPIITAPPSPDQAMLEESAASALYKAEFQRDLSGSDFLHWGEGTVSVAPDRITHQRKPGTRPGLQALSGAGIRRG